MFRADRLGRPLTSAGGLSLALLDLGIGTARKVAGFCALLALGWLYFRELALGQSLHQIFPGAPDPDLRETLWVALLLILAQGWDIPTDHITAHFEKVARRLPRRLTPMSPTSPPSPRRAMVSAASAMHRIVGPVRIVEPVVVRLGRFMDFCVAIANKLGAFAVLVYMVFVAWQLALGGQTVRSLYPAAADPRVDFLADLCVYVVVLAWWATPFEQIAFFWQRLRERRAL